MQARENTQNSFLNNAWCERVLNNSRQMHDRCSICHLFVFDVTIVICYCMKSCYTTCVCLELPSNGSCGVATAGVEPTVADAVADVDGYTNNKQIIIMFVQHSNPNSRSQC